jgi:hypothetical protein
MCNLKYYKIKQPHSIKRLLAAISVYTETPESVAEWMESVDRGTAKYVEPLDDELVKMLNDFHSKYYSLLDNIDRLKADNTKLRQKVKQLQKRK